jgi:hypothetical protein
MKLGEFQKDLELLASKVESEWGALNYEVSAFPSLAAKNLKDFSTENVPTIDDCLNESALIPLPQQHFLHGEFSDFPLTLVKRQHFFLDIYIWYKSDTNIHSHHFCGAFKVISGSSLQLRYKFTPIKEIGPGFTEGNIQQEALDNLPLNSVHPIDPHDQFIHNVFHTGKPTITLCLRTPSFKGEALDVFIFPKYKLNVGNPNPNIIKWLQVAKLALAEGKTVSKIPFSDVDVIRLIYRNFSRMSPIDSSLLDLFQKHLEDMKVAEDFQTVLANQNKFYSKLKILGSM